MEPTKLKGFSNEAVCPKCGWHDIAYRFCIGPGPDCPLDRQEHMHRTCNRCGFELFIEDCLDSKGGGGAVAPQN